MLLARSPWGRAGWNEAGEVRSTAPTPATFKYWQSEHQKVRGLVGPAYILK